jgi:hypothetical protein
MFLVVSSHRSLEKAMGSGQLGGQEGVCRVLFPHSMSVLSLLLVQRVQSGIDQQGTPQLGDTLP